MERWREELHDLLDREDLAASAIVDAIDQNRLEGMAFHYEQHGVVTGCAYRQGMGTVQRAQHAAANARVRYKTWPLYSPLEHFVYPIRAARRHGWRWYQCLPLRGNQRRRELRVAILDWLHTQAIIEDLTRPTQRRHRRAEHTEPWAI